MTSEGGPGVGRVRIRQPPGDRPDDVRQRVMHRGESDDDSEQEDGRRSPVVTPPPMWPDSTNTEGATATASSSSTVTWGAPACPWTGLPAAAASAVAAPVGQGGMVASASASAQVATPKAKYPPTHLRVPVGLSGTTPPCPPHLQGPIGGKASAEVVQGNGSATSTVVVGGLQARPQPFAPPVSAGAYLSLIHI